MIKGLICSALMSRKWEYREGLSNIMTANSHLCLIKHFIFVLNIVSLGVLVENIKAKIVLIIAYAFYAITAHVIDEAAGIVHTIKVLGEICFEEDSAEE